MLAELEDVLFDVAAQADAIADLSEPRYPLDTNLSEYRPK